MGGTYKKKLRAEKAKVKLKDAKLPKGLNVTKTEFKVRKITIKDQLKVNQYVEGHQLINLKETLSRLKHHSHNIRLEAVRCLKDAINIKHPQLANTISDVIQGVSAMCLDQEKDIRRESFKTINSLLVHMGESEIAPFFHIISSYLRCAMTHIQPTILEDSLIMLDVLLQHVPRLVITQSNKIFDNFLEMISIVRSEGDRAGRLLTINMGNRQTTIKWRSKVLQRLQKLFTTLVQYRRQQKNETQNFMLEEKRQKFVTFNTKTLQYYGILRRPDNIIETDINSTLFSSSLYKGKDAVTSLDLSIKESGWEMRGYVVHLMPLLQESWLEVKPQHTTNIEAIETLLSCDALETLDIILDIMDDVWSLIYIEEEQNKSNDLSLWFQKLSGDMFIGNFLSRGYPYQAQQIEDKKNIKNKKKLVAESDVPSITIDCIPQNIRLAYLLCRFKSNNINEPTKQMETILKYLISVVRKHVPGDYWKVLLKVLKIVLLTNAKSILKYHLLDMQSLMRNILNVLLQHKFTDSISFTQLLLILSKIVQDHELRKAYDLANFEEFLNYLPQLLTQPVIQEQTLLALSELAKQRNPQFLQALNLHVKSVVENLHNIQVVGCVNVFEGKKLIINLFYWLKPKCAFKSDEMKDILRLVDENISDKRINLYCHYVLGLE